MNLIVCRMGDCGLPTVTMLCSWDVCVCVVFFFLSFWQAIVVYKKALKKTERQECRGPKTLLIIENKKAVP